MSLDVSDAIALARDLLKTSTDFRAHDRDLAEQFAGRAYEICDDLGIDRSLIGDVSVDVADELVDDTVQNAVVDLTPAGPVDREIRESNQQLRDLLQQQARVLENARDAGGREEPKAARRSSFRLFGGSDDRPFAGFQSASA